LNWLNTNSQLATPNSQLATPNSQLVGPPLWSQTQFVALAGKAAEGVYFVAPAPFPADSADPAFADRYRAISNGVEPRAYAVLAYDAAHLLLDALARDVQARGTPTRTGVAEALGQSAFAGLSGRISFDANRNWPEATGWIYRWQGGEVVKP
jgi:ABC-type branched-subunit amino acid transport system substrate-binding protein